LSRAKILAKFGRNLRDMREAAALSQERLAELCGSHRNYVGGLERGERNPTLIKLVQISQALGKEPVALLHGLDRDSLRNRGAR
jgi:transcriptional regulator with XRE-family HTH domain